MSPESFDVVVIGTGPGGEGAAMRAVKGGKRVAVVDSRDRVGGSCTHSGTIPSKALRHSVGQLLAFRQSPLFGHMAHQLDLSFPKLLTAASSVIDKQSTMRRDFYFRNQVEFVHGTAHFVDAHTVEVVGPTGPARQLRAEHIVIATGSRPYRPPGIDFGHPRVCDSDTILNLTETPGTLAIVGAGVIGCEYASIFRNLGVKVQLINGRSELLSFLDDEIVDALAYHLRDRGVTIRHNETVDSVEVVGEKVVLSLKSGKRVRADVLLYAAGRSGNTEALNLPAIGLVANSRGQLDVDQHFRTTQPHIYAVGDVIGYPSLASASYDQGRFAAGHLLEGHSDERLIRDIPTGIYTDPEISSVGRTEEELTRDQVPYEVGHSLFRHLARAQITGQRVGMLKLLFHRETLQLLGIHCFGYQAAEIVHIGQAIMTQKGEANSLLYFVNTTFNYPTMAEAYRVAALNGLNRLC
ncbi:MAG: Si-specific NAD(P)(+) transhydrogenase [Deltaproteobacteria bacterium]|nr:MAG: Si-specific NAD(P)(+) transhydrogenase [Deltaproteobacteria bacterium]